MKTRQKFRQFISISIRNNLLMNKFSNNLACLLIRKSLFRHPKEVFRLTLSIRKISRSIKITLFRTFGFSLGFNKSTLRSQILLHFFRYFFISQQFINFCDSFKENLLFYLQVSFISSASIFLIDFINGFLNLFTLFLNNRIIEIKTLLTFSNIRVFRIASKFLSFSIQLINSSVGNSLFILHTLTFSNSSNKVKITGTRRGLRIRRRSISSNTNTTGRITKDCLRGYTSRTPFSNLARRFVLLFKVINTLFPVVMF